MKEYKAFVLDSLTSLSDMIYDGILNDFQSKSEFTRKWCVDNDVPCQDIKPASQQVIDVTYEVVQECTALVKFEEK